MEAASRFFFLTITGQYPAGADILGSSLRLADVGVNAVGSLGTRQPFARLGDFQFKQPLALGIEHKWYKLTDRTQEMRQAVQA